MAKGKIHNKTLGQSTYNDEYIDEKFDELTPITDALTGSDVINNLTSTEAARPLSANQGRQLNINKAERSQSNNFIGTQRVHNHATNVTHETEVGAGFVTVRGYQEQKSATLFPQGVEFVDENTGNGHQLTVDNGELLFDGQPIGTGGGGGSGSGGHERIEDIHCEESYDFQGGSIWRIDSASHQFNISDLYAIRATISNQGGTQYGFGFILGEYSNVKFTHESSNSGGDYTFRIYEDKLYLWDIHSGSNYFEVQEIIKIGSGGEAQTFYKSIPFYSNSFSASGQTWMAWMREDGESLEAGIPYVLEGTYWGNPVTLKFDADGWAYDHDNGNSFYLDYVSAFGRTVIVGGNYLTYQYYQFESLKEPVDPTFGEANVDVVLSFWFSDTLQIKVNEELQGMMGMTQYELTYKKLENTIGLETYQSHIILDRKLFDPVDELFGQSPGDTYASFEWMFGEVAQYCEQYGEFDKNDYHDQNIYDYIEQLEQIMMIVDMFNPNLMAMKFDFLYECKNAYVPIAMRPVGLYGMKGLQLVIVPYVKDVEVS